jgi:hypothetical protein
VPHCWSDTTHMGLGSWVLGLWSLALGLIKT